MAKMRIVALVILLQALAGHGSAQQVRLAGGPDSSCAGRLEMFYFNQWNTVNSNSFDSDAARVVCRMLGHDNPVIRMYNTYIFGNAPGPTIGPNFNCRGTEKSIFDCSSTPPYAGTANYNVASISCCPTKIRVVGGDSQTSGRVEINILGAWSTICHTGFSNNDARVICSMLGYGDTGIAKALYYSTYGMSSGVVLINNLDCNGNENDIMQCSLKWWPNCDHGGEAGVSCGATGIRLVNGTNGREGRVELYHAGAWGTICDTSGNFGRGNAMVICRMLGYNTSLAVGISYAFYGEGHGPVIAKNFACDGTESDIANCPHDDYWHTTSATTSHCLHSYDVGVNCAGVTRLRLQDGDSDQSGRVELFRNGHWGTLGSTNFNKHALEVICRMMGYNYSSASFFYNGPYYGNGIGEIVADQLQCEGMESDISFCHGVHWWPQTPNSHDKDVGVNCDGEIKMRVADGPTNGTGRLEIYHGGHWGTVCDQSFVWSDMVVACRSMGYNNISKGAYYGTTYYGQGIGDILVYNLRCTGVEENIGRCNGEWPAPAPNFLVSCYHANDVSVSCDGATKMRVADGPTNGTGRLEIYRGGHWGTVCDQGFTGNDLVVVCRSMGYSNISKGAYYGTTYYGQGLGEIHVYNLRCDGTEQNIGQCNGEWPAPAPNVLVSCYHDNDVSVSCDGAIQMRVADGPTNGTGRLEIYRDGHWGTVCDQGFTGNDLVVACRSMGYSNISKSAHYHGGAFYGEGLGPIHVYNLRCDGTEENIGQCNGIWPAPAPNFLLQCSHAKDMSVSCDGGFGRIRLVDGSTSHEGRVEIYQDNQWWTICPDDFDRPDAVVICKMLNTQHSEHAQALQYLRGTTKYLMSNLGCDGLESNLGPCSFIVKPTYCSTNNAAGVNCCPGCSSSTIIGKRDEE